MGLDMGLDMGLNMGLDMEGLPIDWRDRRGSPELMGFNNGALFG